MAGLTVDPLSLAQIRKIVRKFRKILGLRSDEPVDVLRILEFVLASIGVELEIVPMADMKNNHGETLIGKNTIKIREDVYERAYAGYGRDRLTIAHEIGHLILHKPENISLNRADNVAIPAYLNPEWQANAFAGELLAPYDVIQGKSLMEISNTFGVTVDAAKIQRDRGR